MIEDDLSTLEISVLARIGSVHLQPQTPRSSVTCASATLQRPFYS